MARPAKYTGVADILSQRIQAGVYEPGVPLPPEVKLAASMGVHRLTLRKAFDVLASLLLPALSQARERARRMLCMSNMRQVYIADVVYMDDNNDWLPSISLGSFRSDFNWHWNFTANGLLAEHHGWFVPRRMGLHWRRCNLLDKTC